MKVLSLFSGIGAFEKALERKGIDFELVNYCEFDKYASKSYSLIHNVSETMNLGDITKVNISELKPYSADLITYGFPCQDISNAGKQRGFEHNGQLTRSGLFFYASKIIGRVKPKVAICENVKALTGKKFTKEFETVLQTLEDMGYKNYWQVLNAKDYGIPQNRERVFIVSIRNDIDKKYEFPTPIKCKDIENFLIDYTCNDLFITEQSKDCILNTRYRNTERHKENTVKLVNGEIKGLQIMDYRYDEGLRIRQNKLCPTLTTRGRQSISGVPIIYQNKQLRFIHELECFRLMGFDDADVEILIENGISNTQLYKQAGNSIVVNVLEAIFENLKDILCD